MLPATTGQGEGPPKDNISFVKEIQLMMFGLGDSPTPLATTAHVVENVVLQQMRSFLELLEEVANKRGSETISENDILFLLRKDKHKLKRLLTYISIKELRVGLKSTAINPALIHSTLSDVIVPTATILETKYKKSRIDFLKSIGVNNVDDNNEIDTVKSERDARSYQTVAKISEGAYAAYTTSRQTSFSGGNISSSRFLEWLKTRYLDFPMNKIKPTAVDMLVYLAKETVAQLIDLALLVRQDSNVIPGDPFSRAQQAGCFPYETFGPAQRQIEGSPPIHPNEIREVLRRYWSTQSSPWGAFIVDINCNTYQRLLTVYKV